MSESEADETGMETEQQLCELVSPRAQASQDESLPAAASRGDFDAVKSHIESGLDTESKDKFGNSAFILSCYHGYIDQVKYLLENGASVHIIGNLSHGGETPLHASVLGGNVEIVNILLQHSGVDINAKDSSGDSALHLACQQEHADIVQKIIEHGGEVNMKNCLGRSPIFAAVSQHSIATVQKLAEANADIHECDLKGESVLHLALDSDIVTSLVEKGVNINGRDRRGHTPLMTAIILSQQEKVRTLLSLGADPNIPDVTHKYPIHHAVDVGSSDVLDILLSSDLLMDARDQTGQTAVHYAINKSRMSLIKQLINRGADINAQDEQGYSALMYFYLEHNEDDVENFQTFIDLGYDVNLTDNKGVTTLMHACDLVPVEVVEMLIKAGADIHPTDIRGSTALFYCVCDHDKFSLLVSNGAHIDHSDVEDCSVLHRCAYLDNGESIELALKTYEEQGKDGTQSVDKTGASALHIAAAYGATCAMEVLVNFGANLNARDKHGNTPLHFAAFKRRQESFKFLADAGADVGAKDGNGETPAEVAAKLRCNRILELIKKNEKCAYKPHQNRFLLKSQSIKSNFTTEERKLITNEELAAMFEEERCIKDDVKSKREHIEKLKNMFGIGKVVFQGEAMRIQQSINDLAQQLSDKISEIDPRFKSSIIFTGSATENTKVGFPNEFDVMFVLDSLSEICMKPSGDGRQNALFVQLKLQQDIMPNEFEEFVVNGCVSRAKVFHAFSNLIKTASNSIVLPNYLFQRLPLLVEMETDYKGTTCFHEYIWRGAEYKFLGIEVDMVPAIHVKEWPSFISPVASVGEDIKENGIHLIAKEIDPDGTMYGIDADNLWRISFSIAEQKIMHGLSEDLQDTYRMAKILRGCGVCPDVCVTGPTSVHLYADSMIVTYYLKIALFNLISEQKTSGDAKEVYGSYIDGQTDSVESTRVNRSPDTTNENRSIHDINVKVNVSALYTYLSEAFEKQSLPYYFSPDFNLLKKLSTMPAAHKEVAVNICKMLSEIAST